MPTFFQPERLPLLSPAKTNNLIIDVVCFRTACLNVTSSSARYVTPVHEYVRRQLKYIGGCAVIISCCTLSKHTADTSFSIQFCSGGGASFGFVEDRKSVV